MVGSRRLLVSAVASAGTLWIAGCDTRQPTSFTPDPEDPPAEEAASNTLKYPRGPESLAEMNPYGLHQLRDGTAVRLHDRDPEKDSTPFGQRAIALLEENAKPLPGFPRWRKLTAEEIYALAVRYEFSKNEKDKDLRAKLLYTAATMDHTEAQAHLSRIYYKGLGVKKDYKAAAFWAAKASHKGSGLGAHLLSACYANGWGITKNKQQAREHLLLAARRGNGRAQAILAQELLGIGNLGYEMNPDAARKWLLQAASQPLDDWSRSGKVAGLTVIGLMYERGRGVPQSEIEALAHYYLAKSIAEDDEDGKIVKGNISKRESHMSASARQYAQMRAQELRPTYFEQAIASAPVPAAEAPTIGFGSGVFVTREGHLLTAAHVIESAANVKARVNDETIEAEIIAIDHPNDVALLKVNTKVEAAPIRSSAGVELGNNVFTIGFPNMLLQGTEPKFTEGTISSTSGMRDDPRQFQVSVQVQPGNSGGALFDENGNVVGLVVARLDDDATSQLTGSLPQNVNYAVKSSYALPLLESLKAEMMAEHSRPWFGSNRDKVVDRAKKASVPLIVELKPPRQ
jgi:S1-C subfamily serine protease